MKMKRLGGDGGKENGGREEREVEKMESFPGERGATDTEHGEEACGGAKDGHGAYMRRRKPEGR